MLDSTTVYDGYDPDAFDVTSDELASACRISAPLSTNGRLPSNRA